MHLSTHSAGPVWSVFATLQLTGTRLPARDGRHLQLRNARHWHLDSCMSHKPTHTGRHSQVYSMHSSRRSRQVAFITVHCNGHPMQLLNRCGRPYADPDWSAFTSLQRNVRPVRRSGVVGSCNFTIARPLRRPGLVGIHEFTTDMRPLNYAGPYCRQGYFHI